VRHPDCGKPSIVTSKINWSESKGSMRRESRIGRRFRGKHGRIITGTLRTAELRNIVLRSIDGRFGIVHAS
jgi:hypothetical protein